MDSGRRIEQSLHAAVHKIAFSPCPPKLAAAVEYAVFSGGARVRPRLLLGVAAACGDPQPLLSNAGAAAIELLHCASLVHDDLPCFDDADTRRGKPSVHKAFGEPLAILTGDALIVSAFQTLGECVAIDAERSAQLIAIVAGAVGGPSGIVAGQAWECEDEICLSEYHRAKTASLFSAATTAGAAAAGHKASEWRRLGELLGEAYQIADDICDLVADPAERGKPGKQDQALGRPNAAAALGVSGAVAQLKGMLEEAMQSVPPCPGSDALREYISRSAAPYLPKELALQAA